MKLANIILKEKEMAEHREEIERIKAEIDRATKDDNIPKMVIEHIASDRLRMTNL